MKLRYCQQKKFYFIYEIVYENLIVTTKQKSTAQTTKKKKKKKKRKKERKEEESRIENWLKEISQGRLDYDSRQKYKKKHRDIEKSKPK